MKVRVNFLNGTHIEADFCNVTYTIDGKGNIVVCLDSKTLFESYLISTIASIEFSTEKPQLAVTSVLIFGKK